MNTVPFPFAQRDYMLAPHTRYRIGGPAQLVLFPPTIDDMERAYLWLNENAIPFVVLGGGTNVLIDDSGYAGCVLFTTALKEIQSLGGRRYISGAGVALSELVRQVMLPNNFEGVGALTGIPGTVGGALYMNAGTANGSICQLTDTVSLLRRDGLISLSLTPDMYSYRGQSFCADGDVIAGGTFTFTPSTRDETATYRHYTHRRKETQPEGWCCGSVFRNPPGDHAGRLIEAAGLKGTRRNGAVISDKHANFIMNDDNASFEDVLYLITLIKETVQHRFGVELHEEVRIIGAKSCCE